MRVATVHRLTATVNGRVYMIRFGRHRYRDALRVVKKWLSDGVLLPSEASKLKRAIYLIKWES